MAGEVENVGCDAECGIEDVGHTEEEDDTHARDILLSVGDDGEERGEVPFSGMF